MYPYKLGSWLRRRTVLLAALAATIVLCQTLAGAIVLASVLSTLRDPAAFVLPVAIWIIHWPLLAAAWLLLFLIFSVGWYETRPPGSLAGPTSLPQAPRGSGAGPPAARVQAQPVAEEPLCTEPKAGGRPPLTPLVGRGLWTPESACTKKQLPQIILGRGLLAAMHDYIEDFGTRHGYELEIGGMLTGEFTAGGGTNPPCFRLTGFIEAGPEADCQPGSLLMDCKYQDRQLAALQLAQHAKDSCGMFHLHPGTYDECSGGDLAADRLATADSRTGMLVFVIVTRDNPTTNLQSIRHGRLKFDFYVMGRDLGPDYAAIAPTLEDLPLVQPDGNLVRWLEQRGPAGRLDWLLLRHALPQAKVTLASVGAESSDLWLTAEEGALWIHAWLRCDGAVRVFLANGRKLLGEYTGPWNLAEIGPHVFIAQLLLAVAASQRAGAAASAYGRHFNPLLADKHRLVAEVRSMRERVGAEAELKREGTRLFWVCTIHQCRQALVLEIEYPSTYPNDPPAIYTRTKLKASAPHYLGGHQLCWIDFYGNHSEWNPGRDTAATAVLAAQRWFACYLVWLTLGKWPQSADH